MDYFDGLQLIRAQDSPANKRMFDRTFRDYYGLQYNHHGLFVFSRGGEPLREYHGPHAFITYPGVQFHYGTTLEAPRHHCYVCFRGPRVEQLIHAGLLPIGEEPAVIAIHDSEEFYLTFMELHEEHHKSPPSVPRCVHLLEGLLLQLYESSKSPKRPDDELFIRIETLAQEIRRNPRRQWNFTEAAQRMNVSYAHFRRRFADIHNTPPGRFLLNARLDHAAKMLTASSLPVAIVAEKVGIEDICHFSKLFKRKFLLPPGKYRRDFSEFL